MHVELGSTYPKGTCQFLETVFGGRVETVPGLEHSLSGTLQRSQRGRDPPSGESPNQVLHYALSRCPALGGRPSSRSLRLHPSSNPSDDGGSGPVADFIHEGPEVAAAGRRIAPVNAGRRTR